MRRCGDERGVRLRQHQHQTAGSVHDGAVDAAPGGRGGREQTQPYAAAWRHANEAALAADGPLWVAIGDSMTQGIGASAPERGWVGQLAELRERGGLGDLGWLVQAFETPLPAALLGP